MKKITMVIVGLVLFFGLGEILCRIFLPYISASPAIFKTSDYLPWELLPNAVSRYDDYLGDFSSKVHINGLGLRDDDFSVKKDKNEKRILVLGDSFTFGTGVADNETYSQVLEKLLNEKYKQERFQVMNAGWASGFAPDTEYLFLKTKGFPLKPDLVIVAFFVGNDVKDLFLTHWQEVDKEGFPVKIDANETYYVDTQHRLRTAGGLGLFGGLESTKALSPLLSLKVYIRDHSLFANLLMQRIRDILVKLNIIKKFDPSKIDQDEMKKWPTVVRLILKMQSICKQEGINFAVLIVPEFEELNGRISPFTGLMDNMCKDNGIYCIKLLDYFSSYRPETVYFIRNHHWNRLGNILAAESIMKELSGHKLID